MNSTSGFGRRVVASEGRALTLVSETPPGLQAADLTGRYDLKERVRARLMERIDPAAAAQIPRQRLRVEVTLLVAAIATEEKVQLNEAEEAALANELTDDMIGLGPLEPLLQDDEITDILVNGPFDIYVGRHRLCEDDAAECGVAAHRQQRTDCHNRGCSRAALATAACRSTGISAAQHRRRGGNRSAPTPSKCAAHAAGSHHRRRGAR